MIVDSSAVVAIVADEPEATELRLALTSGANRMSAATVLESSIVLDRRRKVQFARLLDDLIDVYRIEVVPFTGEQAAIARRAYRDYGKGSGHPAQLNFGDCFAYALAADTGEPLLYKGDDFVHTDIRSALPNP
jgi:ribonuclease VapC